jgi:uncharacterized protein
MKTLLVAVAVSVLSLPALLPQDAKPKPAAKKQFVYVLHLAPVWLDQTKWTQAQQDIIAKHVEWLKKQHADGKLVFAGRTMVDNPMGLVVLEVDTEAEALSIMEGDEAVKQKLMTAELSPFQVVLERK